jgi:hypothetical protein
MPGQHDTAEAQSLPDSQSGIVETTEPAHTEPLDAESPAEPVRVDDTVDSELPSSESAETPEAPSAEAPAAEAPEVDEVPYAPSAEAPETVEAAEAPYAEAPETVEAAEAPSAEAPETVEAPEAPYAEAPETVEAPEAPYAEAPETVEAAEAPYAEYSASGTAPGSADDVRDQEVLDQEAIDMDHAPAVEAPSGPLSPGDVPAAPVEKVWAADSVEQLRSRWREIQLMFVDDPRAAAEAAEALIGEAVQQLSSALSARRDDLSMWRGEGGGDTERLRIAVRRYRDFLDGIFGV